MSKVILILRFIIPGCGNGPGIFAGSLEAAYSLNWGVQKIWGKGWGETLALLW